LPITSRTLDPSSLTFESDWIPNRGWIAPIYMTLRPTPALGGTLAEVFHYGFERTGGDVAHASIARKFRITDRKSWT